MPNEISTVRRSLAPTTFAEAMEFSQYLAKSDMVPAGFRNKPENILLAVQWGQEVGLGPMQALQSVAVINGKPSVFGDALLGMVKGSPACEDVIERFEGSGDDLAAVCEAKRAGKAPVIVRFSVADAKKAGLWGKQGPWQQYPRRMLQMRARGFALRDAFPDVLRGVITREEADDYPVDVSKPREPIDVTPKQDLDKFAAPAEIVDAETGEITEAPVVELARQAAAKGRDDFRAFLKSLSDEEFASVKPLVGTREKPGELTLLATRVDEARERDPFGLPPLPENSPPAQPVHERNTDGLGGPAPGGERAVPTQRDEFDYHMAARAAEQAGAAPGGEPDQSASRPASSPGPAVGHPGADAPALPADSRLPVEDASRRGDDLLDPAAENLIVPLPVRPTTDKIQYFGRQLLALIAEAPATPQRLALIRRANERGIALLKGEAVTQYDEVMAALARKGG